MKRSSREGCTGVLVHPPYDSDAHEYQLIKELWAFGDNRITVRFAYEWHDEDTQWFRSYGMKIGNLMSKA
jgi:nuclear transport factor 2 (NTF2) superfamily protein